MSPKANVIEINGKRYDAESGQLLDSAAGTSQAVRPRGHSVDGMVGGRTHTLASVSHTTAAAVADKLPQAPIPSGKLRQYADVIRVTGNHVPRRQATGSKTLMRHAVKKPATSVKRSTKVQQRTDVLVQQPSITVKPKLSSYRLDERRLAHAKQTPRHPEANRYASARPALTASSAKPALASAPMANPTISVAAPALRPAQPLRPAVPQPRPQPKQPVDIFEQALARANHHVERPGRRHTRHRRALFGGHALSIGASALAVVLLVGFFAWQQRTNLTVRYAAAKSGIAASLPAYRPTGFQAGDVRYSPGLVAVNFSNAKSGDSFALIEKASQWDSQALLDSFVATKSRSYQTIDAAGRTIYTYGNNNATWVDQGIWYQINTKGSLTTNQLVNLAISM